MALVRGALTLSDDAAAIIAEMEIYADPVNLAGQKRYGIETSNSFGLNAGKIKELAKLAGRNHALANELRITGYREALHIASLIAEPKKLTGEEIDSWVRQFNSWDVCDSTCLKLFWKSQAAVDKMEEWMDSEEEFVKRAGFALLAACAVHLKREKDDFFISKLEKLIIHAADERNMIKKAVNWSLRQIGKRNAVLNIKAIETCRLIQKMYPDVRGARWIASDALRELTGDTVQNRINKKSEG
jgi:3-methyladenine DNA glycosylase AlkD